MKKLNSLDKITQENEPTADEITTDTPESKKQSVISIFNSLNEPTREIVINEIGKFIENKLIDPNLLWKGSYCRIIYFKDLFQTRRVLPT